MNSGIFRCGSPLATLLSIGIVVVASPGPAVAQSVQTYAAASAGSLSQQSNGPNSALSNTGFVALNDMAGNLGQAIAKVNLVDGSLAAASHGCSIPPLGTFIGYGNGHTSTQFSDIIDLTSATVPAGTLVNIEVHLAATLKKTFQFDLLSLNDDVLGTASLRFVFTTNFTPQIVSNGLYSWQKGVTIQPANGLFSNPNTFTLVGIPVGQSINLSGFLDTNATGRSGLGQEMDSTIRVAANFGMSSLTPGVQLISRFSASPVPGTDTVNDNHLNATLPIFPLPTSSSTAPEPSALVLLTLGAVPVLARRQRH